MEIRYTLQEDRRKEGFVPEGTLPFGKLRTEHMFLMDYSEEGWRNARIMPYSDLSIAPGAVCLHYGQQIFEGLKAFRHTDGEVYLFRSELNAMRLNHSASVMQMPEIDVEMQIRGISALVDIDRLWYPEQEGACIYVRPFMLGVSDALGVRPSSKYLFGVILSPSGPYYASGFSPIKLLLTSKFTRAAPGGSGSAKAGGNYGSSLRAGVYAASKGCKQVLYMDVTKTYIEEAGAMNHYHVTREGVIVIPCFTDTILESVTARSIIESAGRLGFPVEQRRIRVDEFVAGIKDGRIVEAGCLGTAAVVTPVGSYVIDSTGESVVVGDGSVGPVTTKMYELLTSIQYGKMEAPKGWLCKIERR